MEDEVFINGFCRTMNQSRMVTAEIERQADGSLSLEVDCSWGSCVFEGACEVAKKLEELKEN